MMNLLFVLSAFANLTCNAVLDFLNDGIDVGGSFTLKYWYIIVAAVVVALIVTISVVAANNAKKKKAKKSECANEQTANSEPVDKNTADLLAANSAEHSDSYTRVAVGEDKTIYDKPAVPTRKTKPAPVTKPVEEKKEEQPVVTEIPVTEPEEEPAVVTPVTDVAPETPEVQNNAETPVEAPETEETVSEEAVSDTQPTAEENKEETATEEAAATVEPTESAVEETVEEPTEEANNEEEVSEESASAETEETAAAEEADETPAGEEKKGVKGRIEIVNCSLGGYNYILKANNGQILYESKNYKSIDSVNEAIGKFIDAVRVGRFSLRTDKFGNHQFILKSPTSNNLIYMGESFVDENSCFSNIESVKRFAECSPIYDMTDKDVVAPISPYEIPQEVIDAVTATEGVIGRWDIVKLDETQKNSPFVYLLYANNGQLLYQSKDYATAASCRKGIDAFVGTVKNGYFVIYQDKNNRFRFVLRNKTGNTATEYVGQHYDDRKRCASSIESVYRFALRTPIEIVKKTNDEQ